MGKSSLSVVMPVYNEKSTVLEILNKLLRIDLVKEVIVVDDCSCDGTREILKSSNLGDERVRIYCHDKNLGKGAALRTGFQHITGDIVVVQDADLEYDPQEFIEMVKPIENGVADVV